MTNFGSFGSMKSDFNANLNDNNHSSQDINNVFECDSIIMNSAPMFAAMSVDNNLLNPTDTNDEQIHTQYYNFNDSPFNYDNMDCSSLYNII
eukprot:UN01604